jgi:hypothetical protein
MEIERKCIMSAQDVTAQLESCARNNHHMPGVKTELTLSNRCIKKNHRDRPDGSILKQHSQSRLTQL